MINVWALDFDKQNLADYVKGYLNSNSQYVVSLLKVFVGYIHSSAYPKPYYGDFQEDSYDWLSKILNVDYIYEIVSEVLNIDVSTIDKYEQLEHKQTEDNLLKQFIYWYNKKNRTANTGI